MADMMTSLPSPSLENATTSTSLFWTVTLDEDNVTIIPTPTNTTSAEYQAKLHGLTAVQLSAILVPIFFSIIFLVGVIGNSLVITVMMKIYRPQSQGLNSTNRFILNLAISDLFFLFFCVPFQAVIYSMEEWPFGAFMCVFCEFCQKVSMLASVYTLVALSLDRYFAVAFATSAKQIRTRKNSLYCLVTIWVIAVGLGIPALLTRQQIYYENSTLCIINFNLPTLYRVYTATICVAGYVVPLLLIFCCYVGVLRAMSKNARNIAASGNKSSQNSRKRVTKIVIMVVILFAIDWFLHHLTIMWVTFGNFEFNEATYVLKVLAHCLSYANSCVNPIIYAFVSNRFRNDFKKVFTCQYISDALGSVKLYSRRMVASFRYQKRGAGERENSESNGKVTEQKLHPRAPVLGQTSTDLSDSGCHHSKVNTSCTLCMLEKTNHNDADQEEKTKLLNRSTNSASQAKLPPGYLHATTKKMSTKAHTLPKDKQQIEVKIENNAPFSQISEESIDSGVTTTPTHTSSNNTCFAANCKEKTPVFASNTGCDFTIEVAPKHISKSKKKKFKLKHERICKLNMVDEESSNMF